MDQEDVIEICGKIREHYDSVGFNATMSIRISSGISTIYRRCLSDNLLVVSFDSNEIIEYFDINHEYIKLILNPYFLKYKRDESLNILLK